MTNPSDQELRVLKRDGGLEDVSFDKILRRVKRLGAEATPPINVNYSTLVMKVIDQLYDQIPTSVIDELTAEQCASMSTKHLDYGVLASRIVVSNHHKNTHAAFAHGVETLYNYTNQQGQHKPLVSKLFYTSVMAHAEALNGMIEHNRDYLFDYFGWKTLERAYLMHINNKVIERPQHMWLRVSVALHTDPISGDVNLERVKETYDLMSQKYFTHATPTLFNAGTDREQLSSCFLLAMEDDSITGIFNTVLECAQISKWAGGIGLHIHNVRAMGSRIAGTNGQSNGLVPMLKVFNATARYVDQGGGKRPGSFALYLEPWHADIESFLDLKRNHGDEELRARDLFLALWIPDLFMEKVKQDEQWALFCPNEAPGLADVHGDAFKALYEKYVHEGRHRKMVSARALWFHILDSQMETGVPYMLYKDAANAKSNHQHLGTIKSSNLCTEIIEYSDPGETAVCNLASLILARFVDPTTKTFDYEKLHSVTKVVTRNLNKVIQINFYPTEKALLSNYKHRPIGLGVQGLADTFALMDVSFHSEEARHINRLIFETIYHAALEESMTLAKQHGPYASFAGSPTSKGLLQFDMWGVEPTPDRYDWASLKADIQQHGLHNSLLVAPMPTATTSQIMGYNECFEPFTSNLYSRRTNAGEFIVVNKYLMTELISMGLWSDELKDNIILNKGSIQHLSGLSEHFKNKYKTVWEIPQTHLIDMAADRAPFICQSQSLNLWVEDPDYKVLTPLHFYGWQKGLKTGMYYLRRKPRHQPQQFTISPDKQLQKAPSASMIAAFANEQQPACEMCAS